jgi:D-alanine-D-alanine ligase
MIISSVSEIEKCNLQYPLFIKPVSEGTGKGITEKSLVNSKDDLRNMVEYLITRFNQPALVEEYLPGREFTVGVIGAGNEAIAIGGMEIECKDNLPYSVEFKENYQIFCKYLPLPQEFTEECKTVALNVWKALGGVDAGRVDIKADRNGRMCFMEVNPLAGLHPIHSDLPILSRLTGINYQTLMEMIMKSAIKRHHLAV